MKAPLYLDIEGNGADIVVTLSRCLNCGEIKVLSRPCGFDHLAAVMEFNAHRDERNAADPP